MVLPKILYHHRSLLCRAFSVAPDLVAATNYAGLEDWPHNRNPCSQLDLVANDDGIRSHSQGVLQATW